MLHHPIGVQHPASHQDFDCRQGSDRMTEHSGVDGLPVDLEIVRMTEERLVNVWPAVSTMLMDGWAVRFANGYSSRANSASPVVLGAAMPDKLIDCVESLYTKAGLLPTFRITPLAAMDVEPRLLQRGYHIKDEALTMTACLSNMETAPVDPRVLLEGTPSSAWLSGVSCRQEPSKQSADHLLAIVGQLRVSSVFATTQVLDKDIGFGMAAIDRDWAEISSVLLDAAHRGQGFGRVTVNALLQWASARNASHAFLQVSAQNSVARGLYRRLGFKELCGYKTLVKASHPHL